MLKLKSQRQADAFRPSPTLQLNKRPDGADWEKLLAFHITHAEPKLPEPTRHYRFAKALGRRFEADFAWPKERVLVEVQGGIWRKYGGAHSRPDHIERDIEKQQCALMLGYRLLPVTPQDVRSGRALEMIQQLVYKVKPT